MNYLAYSSLLIVLSCAITSFLLFTRSKGNKAGIIWGLFCFLGTTWGIGVLIVSTTQNIQTAVLGWQIANIATIIAPVIHHHFVLAYLNLNKRVQLIVLYSLVFSLTILNFIKPELYFGELKFMFNEFYYIYWPNDKNPSYLWMYWGEYWALLLYSFTLLLNAYRKAEGVYKNRLKYIIFGSTVAWVGTHHDFLPAFGFDTYPYLNITLGIFPFIISYAVIRHRVLDINIVIKRSLIYSLLLTIITFIFLVLVVVFEKIFQKVFGYQTTWGSVLAAILIAFVFNPLREYIQRIVDKILFKATPIELAEQNELLRTEVAEKEKFKAIATLASGIAHEVKNPLSTLKTFIDYLPAKHNDPEFMEKFGRLGNQEIERVNNLVHNLLNFAKPAPPEFKETNIQRLIEETLNLIENSAQKNSIAISYSRLKTTDYRLYLDPNQIKQAFLNILMNAIDAMPNGGTLTITTSLSKDKRSYQIEITDTGCGIAPENINHIFEPFFTKKDKGTGLGLSISYGIIEKHKGKIEVKSAVGVGTEFKIKLPAEKK